MIDLNKVVNDFLNNPDNLSDTELSKFPVPERISDITSNPEAYLKKLYPELYNDNSDRIIKFPETTVFFELVEVASVEDSDDINTYTVKDKESKEILEITISPADEEGYFEIWNNSKTDIVIQVYSNDKILSDIRDNTEMKIRAMDNVYLPMKNIELSSLTIILTGQ